MIPAKVIKINSVQNVDIQPLYKTRYIDGQVVNLPAIQQVPVSMIMGADYSIKVPVAVGDLGYALFCDRDLDAYLASNGEILEPQTSRCHNFSDAIFVPGLVPFSQEIKDETTDLVIRNGKGVFRVKKAGRFIATNGTNELLDLCSKLLQCLLDAKTLTALGPEPFWQETLLQLNDIKQRIDTLKG
jgi:hypothetical protein